jgi:hypothetical protein
MSNATMLAGPSVVAVYKDHASAENAVRLLHKDGFALDAISIMGRNLQVTEEPFGLVSTGDYVKAGARSGALVGGLAGIALGAAFLTVPGVGPIVVAGPLAASVLAAVEGAVAGVAMGAIGGALVRWGVPREHALKYESEVKGGKYLVVVRGAQGSINRARRLLATETPEQIDVHAPRPD